ncbi:MAG: hypothetical protein GSR84_08455 [Desulfurococcales archaeon]|nr:hypothetical protein [Desulfurococcales archaeon]
MVAILVTKFKVNIYYPIAVKIRRKKHKDYVEEYFNNLLFREPIEWPLSIGRVKIEWSDENSVDVDLEENLLLVRVEYIDKLEEVLAKVALLVAPYLVSEYLEPALGDEFSRLISIGLIESILQVQPHILRRFKELANDAFKNSRHKELLGLIHEADDTSLYKHVFLYELRRILSRFGSKVNRDMLTNELRNLLYIIAKLEDIKAPKVCGRYVSLAIVRAGKLEKVALELWEPYVKFVERIHRECPNLQRVYVVSAGRFTSRVVKRLLEYMEENIRGLHLVDRFEYKARYYKGRTNVTRLVAVMEFK